MASRLTCLIIVGRVLRLDGMALRMTRRALRLVGMLLRLVGTALRLDMRVLRFFYYPTLNLLLELLNPIGGTDLEFL